MLQDRYRLIKKKSEIIQLRVNEVFELPHEDSTTFTDEKFLKRGKARVKIPEKYRPPTDVEKLHLVVGRLPPSPKAEPGNHPTARKQRSRICEAWIKLMDPVQKTAWKQLSSEKRYEYLTSGSITVGSPPRVIRTFSKITVSKKHTKPQTHSQTALIINRVKRMGEDPWDVNKIDWGST